MELLMFPVVASRFPRDIAKIVAICNEDGLRDRLDTMLWQWENLASSFCKRL